MSMSGIASVAPACLNRVTSGLTRERLDTMSDVSVVPVDERDNGWEDHQPRFRVYLHGSGESSTSGWTAAYDITGADVLQVVDWAQAQTGDNRTYAVALVYDDKAREDRTPGYGRGLVWLVGMDGNDHVPDHPLLVATQGEC